MSMAGGGGGASASDATGPEALTATSNPYLDFYRAFCAQHPGDLTRVFDPSLGEDERSEMYAALDVGVAMVRCLFNVMTRMLLGLQVRVLTAGVRVRGWQKYAWAIPDERALRIIKHFGPVGRH